MQQSLPPGFRLHIREAIIINKERKKYYSKTTNGKSKNVSNLLITFGYIIYPFAWYFDYKAHKYNKKGIGIIINDFVSLNSIPKAENKPEFKNIISYWDLKTIFKLMKNLRKSVNKELKTYNFIKVYQIVSDSINQLAIIEKNKKVHICILKHILESVAFAAKHANELSLHYQSIKLKKLARAFIKFQILGTILSPFIDRQANKLHKQDCGIIVNDLPSIPY